jgi:hypothetical protein
MMRQRFLAQYMQSLLYRQQRRIQMGNGRRADVHGIQFTPLQHLLHTAERIRPYLLSSRARNFLIDIGDRHNLRFPYALVTGEVRPSDTACTYQANAKFSVTHGDLPPCLCCITQASRRISSG